MSKKILIINGPNLNLLHQRQQDIYGSISLAEIKQSCQKIAQELGFELVFIQSNDEGEIITQIQDAVDKFDAIIINAAAYTHTSIAIRDALEIFPKTKVEIHLSNIYKREEFRHKSLISTIATGIICGFGIDGYVIAIKAMKKFLENENR